MKRIGDLGTTSVLSKYLGFPCQTFHRLLHTGHPSLSGAGKLGHILAAVPANCIVLHHQKLKKNKISLFEVVLFYHKT
jgi:hypothetical protein